MGTHLGELSESYPMNTIMTGFRWFSKIFASLCFEQNWPQHRKGKLNIELSMYIVSCRAEMIREVKPFLL